MELTIKLYRCYQHFLKLLPVITPLSIYHDCSTWKMFWEETFAQVKMKSCGRHNVKENREIKNGEKYIVLEINLKFGNMNKMKITSSKPKYYSGRSGKGLITYLGLKAIKVEKCRKGKVCHL